MPSSWHQKIHNTSRAQLDLDDKGKTFFECVIERHLTQSIFSLHYVEMPPNFSIHCWVGIECGNCQEFDNYVHPRPSTLTPCQWRKGSNSFGNVTMSKRNTSRKLLTFHYYLLSIATMGVVLDWIAQCFLFCFAFFPPILWCSQIQIIHNLI
jgi:hypothetical protein